jgi:hypothetical protein
LLPVVGRFDPRPWRHPSRPLPSPACASRGSAL